MALAPTRQPYRFTVEEYLAFERASDERHEYLDGVIYAMAGESPDHGRICTNLWRRSCPNYVAQTVTPSVKTRKCAVARIVPTRAKASTPTRISSSSVAPCSSTSQAEDVLLNPKVIVEVLSPSTEAFDRGEKFHRYRRWLPTLTDYVLVAQDRPVIDHYQRIPTGSPAPQEQTRWELETLEGLDANLHLPSITLHGAAGRGVRAHRVPSGRGGADTMMAYKGNAHG